MPNTAYKSNQTNQWVRRNTAPSSPAHIRKILQTNQPKLTLTITLTLTDTVTVPS